MLRGSHSGAGMPQGGGPFWRAMVLSAMLIVYRTPVYRIKLFEMSAMWLPTFGTPLAASSAAMLQVHLN